jgi:hypothetical protein
MRPNSKFRVVALSAVLVLVFSARVFCEEANAQPKYERPKTPAISEALEHSLTDLHKAQEQLRTLITEGKMKRYLGIQGVWMAVSKSITGPTNTNYSALFKSQSGPILSFARAVFLGNNHGPELRELRYRVGYYQDGTVKNFMWWGPGDLDFYPSGALKKFSAQIDDRTFGEASWDADGKLKGEGLSPQFPRDEKILPELEDALRHGDEKKRWVAREAMAGIGPASIPYALNVLKDGDERSKELAVGVLQELGKRAASTVPILVRSLREDKSDGVRNAIAVCLGAMGASAEAAIPALEEAATNDIPAVATAAKTSLGFIRESLRK